MTEAKARSWDFHRSPIYMTTRWLELVTIDSFFDLRNDELDNNTTLAAVAKAKALKSTKIADYPNPDLSIEVDIAPPKVDRPGIYAALRVTELWRFDGETEQVIIERMGADGAYPPVEGSGFLRTRADDLRRWVVDENADDEAAWAERPRTWLAAELTPRPGRR